jgi:hypothetical protein
MQGVRTVKPGLQLPLFDHSLGIAVEMHQEGSCSGDLTLLFVQRRPLQFRAIDSPHVCKAERSVTLHASARYRVSGQGIRPDFGSEIAMTTVRHVPWAGPSCLHCHPAGGEQFFVRVKGDRGIPLQVDPRGDTLVRNGIAQPVEASAFPKLWLGSLLGEQE